MVCDASRFQRERALFFASRGEIFWGRTNWARSSRGLCDPARRIGDRGGKAFVPQFGLQRLMPTNSLSYILARAHVASSSFLASQHVTIKHCSVLEDPCRGERI